MIEYFVDSIIVCFCIQSNKYCERPCFKINRFFGNKIWFYSHLLVFG